MGHLYKVIYIEDNVSNTKIVEQLFERYSMIDISCSPNATEGLDLVQQLSPDLILLDINLPDINGIDLFSLIRSNTNLESIPIIAISGNAMAADIQEAMDRGFISYLTKPFRLTSLIEQVESALGVTLK